MKDAESTLRSMSCRGMPDRRLRPELPDLLGRDSAASPQTGLGVRLLADLGRRSFVWGPLCRGCGLGPLGRSLLGRGLRFLDRRGGSGKLDGRGGDGAGAPTAFAPARPWLEAGRARRSDDRSAALQVLVNADPGAAEHSPHEQGEALHRHGSGRGFEDGAHEPFHRRDLRPGYLHIPRSGLGEQASSRQAAPWAGSGDRPAFREPSGRAAERSRA
jgi:hypothetical protein